MAVPLQYQPQFIPTDFGTMGNILGMYRQDMAQRNKEFDYGQQLEAGALAELAQQTTSDVNKQQELIGDLQKRIDEAVNKRGGDYGAAAGDITKMIALERANPWYKYDQAALNKMQEYGKMQKSLGLDFYATKDPRKVSYEDWIADPTSLDFNVYNLSQLDKLAVAKAKEKATEMTRPINTPVEGMMREIGNAFGFETQDEALDFMAKNPNFIGDIAESYGIDDPNVINRLQQAALTEMVGKRDTRFVADQEAITRYNNPPKEMPEQLPFHVYQNLDVKQTTEKIQSNIGTLKSGIRDGKMDSSSIPIESKMFDPFMEGVVFDFMDEMQFLGESAWNLGLNILNMEESQKEHSKYWEQGPAKARQNRKINKYEVLKDAYEKKYPNIKKTSKNDEEFLNKVEQLEIANSVIKGSELSLADPSLAKNLFVAVKELPHKRSKAETFINKETGKGISRKEAEERLGAAPLQIRINSEGMLTVAIPNKDEERYEDYIINPDALPAGISKNEDKNTIHEISSIFNRYDLKDEEINNINKSVYRLEGSPYFYRVVINPSNPIDKKFVKIVGKDEFNNFIEQPATLSELQFINAAHTFKSINPE